MKHTASKKRLIKSTIRFFSSFHGQLARNQLQQTLMCVKLQNSTCMFSQFSFQDMYPNEICTLTVCSNTSITQADHLPHQFWHFLLPLIHLPDHTHFSGVPQQRQCGHSHRRMSMLCHLCQSEHEHLQLVEKKKIIFFISKQNKQDYVSIIQPECRNIKRQTK